MMRVRLTKGHVPIAIRVRFEHDSTTKSDGACRTVLRITTAVIRRTVT